MVPERALRISCLLRGAANASHRGTAGTRCYSRREMPIRLAV